MYKDIVIVSAVRRPFGRYGDSLRKFDYLDLGAILISEALRKVNLEPQIVNEFNV